MPFQITLVNGLQIMSVQLVNRFFLILYIFNFEFLKDLASGVTNDDQELNIESFETNNMPAGKNGKDTYSLEKEMRALSFLLGIFQKSGQHYIPLSKLENIFFILLKNFLKFA